MVDINLIGDDKTGEEDRVEDFTQTSSMDTQELAFEERTETFDTTKTAGFAQKRSYSSLVSTLIIVAVIVLLGGAIYFFMFSDDSGTQQTEIPEFTPGDQAGETVSDEELAQFDEQFADQFPPEDQGQTDNADFSQVLNSNQDVETTPPPVTQTQPEPTQTETPTPVPARRNTAARTVDVSSGDFLAATKSATAAVSDLLTSVPSNLNVTLLSYNPSTVRIELVANTVSEARDFASTLNSSYPGANFSIVSQSPVSSNGSSLEKVLLKGAMTSSGGSGVASARFLNLGQTEDWLRKTAQQYGLQVYELKGEQASFSGGYQRVPILGRFSGSPTAIIGMLRELGNQSLNLELSKVLLASPDMNTYSDDNLTMLMYMFLYQQ